MHLSAIFVVLILFTDFCVQFTFHFLFKLSLKNGQSQKPPGDLVYNCNPGKELSEIHSLITPSLLTDLPGDLDVVPSDNYLLY